MRLNLIKIPYFHCGLKIITLFVIVLSVVISCKPYQRPRDSVNLNQQEGSALPINLQVIGNWISDCLPSGVGSTQIEALIAEANFLLLSYNFADAQCLQPTRRDSFHFNYKIDKISPDQNSMVILLTHKSAAVKPQAQVTYETLQSKSYCQSQYWRLGEEKNVSTTNCGDATLNKARFGVAESLHLDRSTEQLWFGTSVLKLKRKAFTESQKALDLNLAPQQLSQTAPEPFTSSVVPCQNNPKEACGNFSPAMRRACMLCGGGIDTCREKNRWDFNFTVAIARGVATLPPEGLCKEKGKSEREPMEKHDEIYAKLSPQVAKQVAQQQSAQPVSKKQLIKEFGAQAAGFGASVFVAGLCNLPCAVASMAVAPVVTHGVGSVLDILLPTKQVSEEKKF